MVRRIALIASATGAAAIFGVAVASAALVTYFGPAFISPGLPKTKGGSIVTQTQNFMGKNSGSGNQCKVRLTNSGGSTIAGTTIQATCNSGTGVLWTGSVAGRPVCEVGSPSVGFNATCSSDP